LPSLDSLTTYSISGDEVITSSSGERWVLKIESATDRTKLSLPETGEGWENPPVASGNGAVYRANIGPPDESNPNGIRETSMPVIAFVRPGGGVTWRSIPPDWWVVSSNTQGTVLNRVVGDQLEIALADFGD
jgi:hypothetical protein